MNCMKHAIDQSLDHAYAHHIQRLMITGNFCMLTEIHPDQVDEWYLGVYIDAIEWVELPNTRGMSQFADGGLMATKPYISGSNYILKMSDYKKGEWQATWDGLFWKFMNTNREFFLSNPRLGMLVRMFDKMPVEKQEKHIENGTAYLSSLAG